MAAAGAPFELALWTAAGGCAGSVAVGGGGLRVWALSLLYAGEGDYTVVPLGRPRAAGAGAAR
jgi:hypothetical protein